MGRHNSIVAALIVVATLISSTASVFAVEGPTASALGGAVDRAGALMDGERWAEAAKVLDEALLLAPNEHDLHFRRGKCALGLMDLSAADKHFEHALGLDPGVEGEVAKSWKGAALRALDEGKLDRAVAMFAKAFYHDKGLGAEIGRLTIEAAREMGDEDRRAGYMTRAIAWAGSQAVLEASIAHYSRAFGAPRRVYLENPGWVDLAKLRPGDELLYLSRHPFQQRDVATMRIVPAAVTQPMKLSIEERDTNGAADTLIRVARHQLPTSAYIWLLPGADTDQ